MGALEGGMRIVVVHVEVLDHALHRVDTPEDVHALEEHGRVDRTLRENLRPWLTLKGYARAN